MIHPGTLLRETLEGLHWTQGQFAEIVGRPQQFVSEIINGKKEITRESAAQFGAALGIGPEVWLVLQDSYHLWDLAQSESHQKNLREIRLRAGDRA